MISICKEKKVHLDIAITPTTKFSDSVGGWIIEVYQGQVLFLLWGVTQYSRDDVKFCHVKLQFLPLRNLIIESLISNFGESSFIWKSIK